MRCSAHSLPIESGRWSSIPTDEQLCHSVNMLLELKLLKMTTTSFLSTICMILYRFFLHEILILLSAECLFVTEKSWLLGAYNSVLSNLEMHTFVYFICPNINCMHNNKAVIVSCCDKYLDVYALMSYYVFFFFVELWSDYS